MPYFAMSKCPVCDKTAYAHLLVVKRMLIEKKR